jgi:hypothetical protein
MKDQQEQRLIIESFRSGVPSRRVASRFPMGRERLLGKVRDEIQSLRSRGSQAIFVKANYGEGKTHLLHAIWDMALREECVVSLIILSKETPFDKLYRVYPKVIAGTYLPGSSQPGIEQLISDVRGGSQEAGEILGFAESNLHPKIAAVLRNYIEGQYTDAYGLYQDLAGEFMRAQDLKAIHRLNFHETLKLSRFTASSDTWDYFRMVDALARLRGYRGWVLLIDEAELIGKLGAGARARSYANINRFLSPKGGLANTLSVFTVATSFFPDVLDRLNDSAMASEWLRTRGLVEEAQHTDEVLDKMVEAEALLPLSEEQLAGVMEQIVSAHSKAYGWTPPLNGRELLERILEVFPARDTKLRTRIRAGIQWLDHLLQYNEDPILNVSDLVEEYEHVDEEVSWA